VIYEKNEDIAGTRFNFESIGWLPADNVKVLGWRTATQDVPVR